MVHKQLISLEIQKLLEKSCSSLNPLMGKVFEYRFRINAMGFKQLPNESYIELHKRVSKSKIWTLTTMLPMI